MNRVALLSVPMVATRFEKGPRWAAARVREMRHVVEGGELFTTEEWLAEWLAARSIPQQNWPPKDVAYDPLEEAVASRVLQLVGSLAASGKIRVVAL